MNGVRQEIIQPLKNASSQITNDSTWSDIVSILWSLYPDKITMTLYNAGVNTGNFSQFSTNGKSSVTFSSSSINLLSYYDEDAVGYVGIITDSQYGIDRLTKLTVTYNATSVVSKSNPPYVAYVKIGLFKTKSFNDSSSILFTLANNFTSASGTITNDISNITGNYYIGVIIHAPYYYSKYNSCVITNIQLSNF